MKYINRVQEKALRGFLNSSERNKNVLLVEGARQVGKTTLVEYCLKKVKVPEISLNLDFHKRIRNKIDLCSEFGDFELILMDEIGFDPEKESILFIDEAQESEKLGSFVRFMKEKWDHTIVILSGSTLVRLFRKDQRFPVGRISCLLVTPFNFDEFLSAINKEFLIQNFQDFEKISLVHHQSLLSTLDTFLQIGGLPAVVSSFVDNDKWFKIRDEIIADYDDDLRRIFGEEMMPTVRACIRAVAQLVGSTFKNTAVIKSPSTGQNESITYVLSRLEEWKLVIKSSQSGLDPIQSYQYHPKRYLFDTGILRGMRELGVPSIKLLETPDPATRTALGGVVENQTAIDLSRFGSVISGWKKSSSGTEIDFIIKKNDITYPVECKASIKVKGSHLAGIRNYMHLYSVKTGFIISLAPYEKIVQKDGLTIYNIPLYLVGKLFSLL
ncbi:MAG: AAA family ATPase [Chitinivibrionales bacterium]|nr:AAA family ATPase [Chitinivibrionales bacterium]